PFHHYVQLAQQTTLLGIAPQTLNSYFSTYIKFPSFDILTVSSFVCYCRNSLKVRASTTKVYLCAIHFFHKLLFGTNCPSLIHPQISLLLKGFQRLEKTLPNQRTPLTSDILESCIYVLRSGYHSPWVDRTLLSDISILSSDTLTIYLKKSKIDQLGSGTLIYYFKLCSYASPYESLSHYAHLRTSAGVLPTDPLFVNEKGHIVTCNWFLSHLSDILLTAGYPPEQFSGHSFRSGAAASAARQGIPEYLIKQLGCWSSEAYHAYIKTNPGTLKQA
uniref:Tyr recombinase domain-containing protein n=1 Tax=Lepisosteus oculatus TaxID=7918 RepID=W5MBB8_LEPOC